MNDTSVTFNAFPVESEEFSAGEFLAKYERLKDNLRSVQPVPAKIRIPRIRTRTCHLQEADFQTQLPGPLILVMSDEGETPLSTQEGTLAAEKSEEFRRFEIESV